MATSGTFSTDGETLLVADYASETIFPYSMEGRARSNLPPELRNVLGDLPPLVIARQSGQLYVEISQSRVLTLGSDYSLKAEETVRTANVKGKSEDLTLQGMFLWQPAGSDFLAFSDVEAANERWSSAFVRFPARDPASFEVLHSIGLMAPSRVFYQLGLPYITSLGSDGYLILMENPVGIYRSRKGTKGLEPLNAFPRGFEQSSELSTLTAKSEIVGLMAKVEQSKMPVGLYGWRDFLYVLTREPEGQGTRWKIFKIDPRRDEVVGSTLLPTRANHLTVIPGPKRWAFIEKGPLEAWDRQRIDHLFFVPSSRLQGKMPAILCRPGELQR